MSRHLIFGAGLIGGYMAGCFAAKGLPVTVVGRESMRRRFAGELKISDYHGHQTEVKDLNFIVDGEPPRHEYDFIWLTVKCTGLDQALIDLVPFVNEKTVILSCQNGLGSDRCVNAMFPNNKVRRVIMTPNIAQLSYKHLHRGSQGDLLIQAYELANGSKLSELVSSELLLAQHIENIEAYSWAKLQLNLGNAVNALANMPVKEMLEHRAFRRIIALAMQELIRVVDVKGIMLPKLAAVPMRWIPHILKTPNFIFSRLGAKMLDIDPTVRTSMWWDLNNHRLTEVDSLNGAVVSEGAKLSVNCSVNQAIVKTIHAYEVSIGTSRQPFSAEDFLANRSIGKW